MLCVVILIFCCANGGGGIIPATKRELAANRRSMFEYDTYIYSRKLLRVNQRIRYLFLSKTKRGIDDEPNRRTAKNSFMVHFDSAHLPHWPEI